MALEVLITHAVQSKSAVEPVYGNDLDRARMRVYLAEEGAQLALDSAKSNVESREQF
jgi:hypothetical protein